MCASPHPHQQFSTHGPGHWVPLGATPVYAPKQL
jgi:hypothetical protein